MEREIVKLLKKISKQLDEVSRAQQEIKEEIYILQNDIAEFQESTLRNLERKFTKTVSENLLN